MLLDRYLPRIDFDSYEDFKENYRVNVPEDFNFGWDIVDEWAKQEPEKKAMLWLSQEKEEHILNYNRYKKQCVYARAKKLKVVSSKNLTISIDGEIFLSKEINVEVLHHAINFVIPK